MLKLTLYAVALYLLVIYPAMQVVALLNTIIRV